MCMVSMIGDEYYDKWRTTPWQPYPQTPYVPYPADDRTSKKKDIDELLKSIEKVVGADNEVSRQEFDDLKKEVEELKKLLAAAKEYDKNTGQPDCEQGDKVEFIKRLADFLGVDLGDVFGS